MLGNYIKRMDQKLQRVITAYAVAQRAKILRSFLGWAPWLKPVIPALWEAEAGRSGVRDQPANMVKPHLYLKIQKLAQHDGGHL